VRCKKEAAPPAGPSPRLARARIGTRRWFTHGHVPAEAEQVKVRPVPLGESVPGLRPGRARGLGYDAPVGREVVGNAVERVPAPEARRGDAGQHDPQVVVEACVEAAGEVEHGAAAAGEDEGGLRRPVKRHQGRVERRGGVRSPSVEPRTRGVAWPAEAVGHVPRADGAGVRVAGDCPLEEERGILQGGGAVSEVEQVGRAGGPAAAACAVLRAEGCLEEVGDGGAARLHHVNVDKLVLRRYGALFCVEFTRPAVVAGGRNDARGRREFLDESTVAFRGRELARAGSKDALATVEAVAAPSTSARSGCFERLVASRYWDWILQPGFSARLIRAFFVDD
jgi:hypothetical protein